MQATKAPKAVERTPVSIGMHPEIKIALKVAAAVEETTMSEKLHAILCLELDRADLLMPDPEPARAR